MTKLEQLRQATTLRDLADLLGVTAPGLAYILYHKPRDQLYRSFEIPKRKGGTRNISAPTDELKTIQRKLASLLQECWLEIGEGKNRTGRYPGRKDRVAHGFLPGRSIRTNARQHRRKRYLFNVDLEDFFGSINFGRVFGFFKQDNNFKLQPRVAAVVATIACFENKLPQGSPCSPIISNLIAKILDARIAGLTSKVGVNYSRYADDLSFSSNDRNFPNEIANLVEGGHSWSVGKTLGGIIKKSGFRVNPSKTRMQYNDSRQEVTGLIVNRRINVRSEYRRAVRAMGHRLFSTGTFNLPQLLLTNGEQSTLQPQPGSISQLHGMMSFIASIDRLHREAALSRGEVIEETGAEKLYRNFLYYRFFYKNDAPIILCEGITDNIYIRCAIRALRENYPLLVKPRAEAADLLVKFYKYRGAAVDTVLQLKDGGAGNLQNFMVAYKKASKFFVGPGKENPVIIIVDNDEGGRKVIGTARELSGKAYDGSQDYLHVYGNLYLIATHPKNVAEGSKEKFLKKGPRPSDSCIEEYFSEELRGTKINGRTLTLKNNNSGVAHYGKMDFAKQVVENLRETEHFHGFSLLLDRVNLVVDCHKSSLLDAEVVGAAADVSLASPLATETPTLSEIDEKVSEIAEAAD